MPCSIKVYCVLLFAFFIDVGEAAPNDVSGGELVVYRCTECHTLQRVFRAHYDEVGWMEAISRMEEQGLFLEEEERSSIIQFLAGQREGLSLLQLFGMQHFWVLHFPVVLLLFAAFFEARAWWCGNGLAERQTDWFLTLGTVTCLLAVSLGLALIFDRETLSAGLELHRNLGIATAILLPVTLVCRRKAVKRGTLLWMRVYRGLLLLVVFLVMLAADRGGTLVHGNFMSEMFSRITP